MSLLTGSSAPALDAAAEPLPVLEASGFSAHVDACAWEPATAHPADQQGEVAGHDRLWLVSLLGAQQSLKALWARLLQGERVTLRVPAEGGLEEVRFCTLARATAHGPVSWRLFSASLPHAAGYHAVVAPAIALHADDRPDFVMLPRSDDEAPLVHYRFLNRRCPLPLHPDWTHWLWRRAVDTGEAVGLQTHRLRAFLCAPNTDALRADITTALRRRDLSRPPG